MLSLSLDYQKQPLTNYIKKESLNWPQAWLRDWQNASLPDRYGVYGIPPILLIGPDGRIVAKDLRGAEIKQRVADALAQEGGK
jgi:hypothetical protein